MSTLSVDAAKESSISESEAMTDEGSIVLVYVDCVNLCMLTGHAYLFRIGVVWEVLTA